MDIDGSSSTPSDYLSNLLSRTPESLHDEIRSFQRLSERKLWHQLTNALLSFLRGAPSNGSGPFQVELWNGFIGHFKKKVDQLRLVEMATLVAQQYDGRSSTSFSRFLPSSL